MKKKSRPKTRASRAPKKTRRKRTRAAAKPLRIIDAVTRGPGRPSKYVAEYAHLAASMCKLGATDFELAQAFGVAVSTIYEWMRVHPEFSESIKAVKALPNDRVERSLYARATGYSVKATKIIQTDGQVVAVEYVEHYPPDVTAAAIWLNNRDPLNWRRNREPPQAPSDTKDADPRKLSREEIHRRLAHLEEQRKAEAAARAREEAAGAAADPKK